MDFSTLGVGRLTVPGIILFFITEFSIGTPPSELCVAKHDTLLPFEGFYHAAVSERLQSFHSTHIQRQKKGMQSVAGRALIGIKLAGIMIPKFYDR